MAPRRRKAGKGAAKGGKEQSKAAASKAASVPTRKTAKRKAASPPPVPEKKTSTRRGRAASPSPSPAPKVRQSSRGRTSQKDEEVVATSPPVSKGRGRSSSTKEKDVKSGRVTRAVVEAASPSPRGRGRSSGRVEVTPKAKAETPKQKATPQKAATPKQKAPIPKQKTASAKKTTPKPSPKQTPSKSSSPKKTEQSPASIRNMRQLSVSLEKMDDEDIKRSSISPVKDKPSPVRSTRRTSKSPAAPAKPSPRPSRRSRGAAADESPLKKTEATDESPLKKTEATEESPLKEPEAADKSPLKEPEAADESPLKEPEAESPLSDTPISEALAIEEPEAKEPETKDPVSEAPVTEASVEESMEQDAGVGLAVQEEQEQPAEEAAQSQEVDGETPKSAEEVETPAPEEEAIEAVPQETVPTVSEPVEPAVVELKASVEVKVDESENDAEMETDEAQAEPAILENDKLDASVETPIVKDPVAEPASELGQLEQEAISMDIPVVDAQSAEVIENEDANQTGVEMAEEAALEVSASSDSSSQPNGQRSADAVVSPRKRKHDELEDDFEVGSSPKKIRRSLESEENAQEMAQSNGGEVVEDLANSYVVVNMSDVPACESEEVLQSLPKEQSVTTDFSAGGEGQAAMAITNPSQDGPSTSKQAVVAPSQAVNASGEDANPIFCRDFIPNPTYKPSDSDVVKQFTIMSYNVLADFQIRRNNYSFTDPKFLEPGYRYDKLIEEIQFLNADVVCLQEVEPEFYNGILKERMESKGYQGFYKKRTTKFYNEGEATFFQTSRFTVVESNSYSLKDLVQKEIVEGMSVEIQQAIGTYMDLADVLIVTKLKCNTTGKEVTIGNIHVVWGEMKIPDAQCVQIASAIKEVVSKAGSVGSPHIICGDFNSEPYSPGYLVAKAGYLGDDTIPKLQQIQNLTLGEGETASLVNCAWQAFQHTSNTLKSAYCETQSTEPKVTSFNQVMCACVDYIFYSSGSLDSVGVYQTAPDAKIKETGGIPNCYFPSDHVSMKAKFAFM